MRLIKTYVMTVGVALSVAPIFNYALAQQGNSATQLMLQVQTMRQEVGELRDLIDRQHFQLRRLQRQVDAQANELELIKSIGLVAPSTGTPSGGDLSNYNDASPETNSQIEPQPQFGELQPNLQEPQPNLQELQPQFGEPQPNLQEPQPQFREPQQRGDSSVTNESNRRLGARDNTGQQTAWEVAKPNVAGDFYRPTTQGQVESQGSRSAVSQSGYDGNNHNNSEANPTSQQISARQQAVDTGVSVGSAYPPVIERSFSTSVPDVPVTGAGTRQPSSAAQQTDNGQSSAANPAQDVQGTTTLEGAAAFEGPAEVQGATNTTDQNQQAISLPTNSGAIVAVPNQAGQARESIDAGQIPIQGSDELSDTQTESSQAEPTQSEPSQSEPSQVEVPTVVPEEDYYTQGFELLKQSKYEEAALIFEQQLKTHPQGDLADDAHYWIAEAMHVSRKLDIAKIHLKAIINDYPQSRRVPDAMLKTAYIEQGQGNQMEARILFQEIVNLHPQSDAAIAAKNQLAASN